MKIREALAALDRTKVENQKYHIHNMMERVFPDIPSCYISDDYYNDTRFGIYPLLTWICTDTEVGYRAYFLDDELIAIGCQFGRKCNEDMHYTSKTSYSKLRDYILSLMPKDQQPQIKLLESILDEELNRP